MKARAKAYGSYILQFLKPQENINKRYMAFAKLVRVANRTQIQLV